MSPNFSSHKLLVKTSEPCSQVVLKIRPFLVPILCSLVSCHVKYLRRKVGFGSQLRAHHQLPAVSGQWWSSASRQEHGKDHSCLPHGSQKADRQAVLVCAAKLIY